MKKRTASVRKGCLLTIILAALFLLQGCGSGGSDAGFIFSGAGTGGGTAAAIPAVTAVSSTLAPGQECTIDGTGFGASRAAKESGTGYVSFVAPDQTATRATRYSLWSDTRIQCLVPSLIPNRNYSVVVTVVSEGGSSSSTQAPGGSNTLTVIPKTPVLLAVQPAITNLGDSASLTLTGADFGDLMGSGYVRFGRENGGVVQKRVLSWGNSRISCTLPAGVAAGTDIPVYVISDYGAVSNSAPFTVSPAGAPIITGIAPGSAAINSAPTITVTGNNFGDLQGNGTMTLATGTAPPTVITTFAYWSNGTIILTLPRAATATRGTLNISVRTDRETLSTIMPFPVGGVGRIYALFVGINRYHTIPGLNECVNDVNNLKTSLMGTTLWSGADIITLTDLEATKSAVTGAITTLGARSGPDDTFFFYYSGHGSNDGASTYICPTDTGKEVSTMISDSEMNALLSPMAGKKALIFDSCHSGGFAGKNPGLRTRFHRRPDSVTRFHGPGFARVITSIPSMVFLSACKGDELSSETEDLGGGIFTYYLIEALGTGAGLGCAAGGGTGLITVQGAYTYATPRASAYNPDQNAQIQDNYPQGLTIKQQGD